MSLSLRRRPAVAIAAALLSLTLAHPAAAHSDVHHSEPADGAVLRTPPSTILLTFMAPMQVTALRLVDQAGRERPVRREGARSTAVVEVRAAVQGALPPGDYRVEWRGASQDGHVGGGTVRFTVEPSR